MRKRPGAIPVNQFGDETGAGISIERIAFKSLPPLGDWEQPERHDRHSFFLLEKGMVTMEIDFQIYEILSPSIIYMHPDQVHRIIGFESVTVCAWAIEHEKLNAGYLKLLEEISPAAPIHLNYETSALLIETASLCIKLAHLQNSGLHVNPLKEQANVLVALVLDCYLENKQIADKLTRAEFITKAFRAALSLHFIQWRHPVNYAEHLNISTAYLNECVKNSTGQPVSYHIQQRLILEAKRLLYHSNQSLKEIASVLGYDDYAYFSRLFTKVTGVNPSLFRHKNHD